MTEETKEQEETKQDEQSQEIELSAKVDGKGHLTWKVPDNMQVAAWLLLHLNTAVQKKHSVLMAESMRQANERKPNIITSLKRNPIMRKVFR